jgi:SAM-dependent methyltransferase
MAYEEGYERAIAANYDRDYAVIRDPSGDREFYAALARESGGPVLELGCGTGRILLPIAREGIACVGLDSSAAMLDVFRAKDLPANLALVEGDVRRFDLGRKFRLITLPFRVIQHLVSVDEQLACLDCCRRHLEPGGKLALDVFAPDLARMASDEPERLSVETTEGDDEVRRYDTITRDLPRQVSRVRFRYERRRGGAVIHDSAAEFDMRWYWRFELEHLLVRAGFEPVGWYGGFDGRPYDAKKEIIVVAGRP